jgi:hypothetical protein
MMRITDDPAHDALVVEPQGRLEKADFEALSARFDRVADEWGRIPNLVVHAPAFPGWADFAGFLEHLQFIRAHERLVPKIALVSDSVLLDIVPRIARHFVSADVRTFPAEDLAAALRWSAEPGRTP